MTREILEAADRASFARFGHRSKLSFHADERHGDYTEGFVAGVKWVKAEQLRETSAQCQKVLDRLRESR